MIFGTLICEEKINNYTSGSLMMKSKLLMLKFNFLANKSFNTSKMVTFWLVLILASCYAISLRIPQYFFLDKPSNFLNHLPHPSLLYIHIICGLIAMICGPLQFIRSLRVKNVKIHHFIGKTYLVSILIVAITALFLACVAQKNLVYSLGLGTLGVILLVCAVMGYFSIRRKQIHSHQQWMIRSYICIFTFTIFRLSLKTLLALSAGITVESIATFLSWFSWLIPLLIFEVLGTRRGRE